MENTLRQSLLKTLAFFDIFDYPLTREELFLYLWEAPIALTYSDFVAELEKMKENKFFQNIEQKGGYYFLAGRSEIIIKRERKISYTEEKIKIARHAAQKLRYIPFIEAMFVCNLLPVGVKASSDIDVLIIPKEGHIWLSRFLSTLVLTLFRLRPTNFGIPFVSKNKSMTDKICLSFYLTDTDLDLSDICIEGVDVYQVYWNLCLIPIYDRTNLYTKFQEKNIWTKKYIPNFILNYDLLKRWKISDTQFSYILKKLFEWFFPSVILEKQFRSLQLKQLNQKEKFRESSRCKNIVISDTMLKFHENDRKKYFQEEWEKRWNK